MYMFFKKKEDNLGLPDLPPESNSFVNRNIEPPEDDELTETHSLPSFPDSPSHNKFSQAMIKEAVGEPAVGERRNPATIELEEWRPERKTEEGNYFSERKQEFFPRERTRTSMQKEVPNDVFVKIEKFRMARRSLDDVKEKLGEIDEMIKRIRETKLREEQEFAFWEKELEAIKGHVQEVTENIFEKVD